MNLHEYQGKQLFAEYGLPVSQGYAVDTPEAAAEACDKIGGTEWVVKAQVHAGGRGKAGGVKLVRSKEDAKAFAQQWLGKRLVTYQTDANGQPVTKILVESCTDIAKELYLGAVVDRSSRRIVFMASTEGGVDIEAVAEESPEKIINVSIDPETGVTDADNAALADALKLEGEARADAIALFPILYKAFVEKDMSLLEINPLIVMTNGRVRVLDAKVSFDNNALFRHPDILELRDTTEEDEKEIEASKYDLAYVALDGNIGCMVNGAGLAMATMDIIKLYGAEPANFLDVGGGANKEKVTAAFKIITADPAVEGILVNIFGGIMKCDIIAEGVIAAVKEVGLKVPLVVRLEGTNVELGKKIINESGLNVISADDLDDAAQKIVAAVKGN